MQKKVMLSENILREAKDDTSNPMSGTQSAQWDRYCTSYLIVKFVNFFG